MIELNEVLVLAAMLFCISVAGIFINRKNVIILLMCIELMLLSVNLNFIAFSHFLGDIHGQVFVFFILTVAAAEAAIGLAILVVLFRNRNTINVVDLDTLRG
ncbi:MAG: NADH-quinone oxidoreductase subunit NuoK [Gammaproteobacteria bacterium]|nr:NADH-quinone oxidoreductase subunit NuoK [Gammaproteobacteria bacterium]MDE0283480.1 NADH-quinone oxidoreductase subunit NuoK [Gammaproteobacteria bacterium]MDE0514249.1 NADH-quinone oxidoreductase subunit NuoK [Gammaproteobacteria bacterium]